MKCPWQEACEAFELWGLSSEEWETQYLLPPGWHQDGPFDAEPRSLKTLKDCLSPDLKKKERPIWKQVHVSVKRPVSAKPQILEIQVLLLPTVYVLPSSGGGGWGGALEYLVGKYRMDNSMCAQGENKPMDSDSIPEKIGLQGIETQFHSPEISPTNPTSFPAVQKPPSQRDDLGCQGNLTPE